MSFRACGSEWKSRWHIFHIHWWKLLLPLMESAAAAAAASRLGSDSTPCFFRGDIHFTAPAPTAFTSLTWLSLTLAAGITRQPAGFGAGGSAHACKHQVWPFRCSLLSHALPPPSSSPPPPPPPSSSSSSLQHRQRLRPTEENYLSSSPALALVSIYL